MLKNYRQAVSKWMWSYLGHRWVCEKCFGKSLSPTIVHDLCEEGLKYQAEYQKAYAEETKYLMSIGQEKKKEAKE